MPDNAANPEAGLRGDERILAEAKRRFKDTLARLSNTRKLFGDDIKFDAADSDNGYQWPGQLLNTRTGEDQPCLTINKTHQHNLQIINDAKQNKPGVKIIATGDGASAESAQVFADVVRRIEYISNAQAAYDTAVSYAVRGGFGWWRILPDYCHDGTFDQDLFIQRVKNPLSVIKDLDVNEADGSDADFGFVYEDRPTEEVAAEYPRIAGSVGAQNAVTGDTGNWVNKDHTRIVDYYRRVKKKDKLILLIEPEFNDDGSPNENAGQQLGPILASEMPKRILRMALEDSPDSKVREITTYVVEWYKIVGNEIVDERSVAAGKRRGPQYDAYPIPYIPLVQVVGEEFIIEGKVDWKSHTRAMKDPQRMLNYNSSASVQFGALQSKTPYVAPARAIEGYETYWNNANRTNPSILPFNDYDEAAPQGAQTIAAPQRQQPPATAPAFMQGMVDAERQLMMVSGQFQSQTGEQENAKTRPAIMQRQRQGDNATYHFTDNEAIALRLTGKILIAWIPHIYDTARVLKIRAQDGTEREVNIDPQAKQALVEKKDAQLKVVESIFNPSVGKYDVEADVGPGYATKRQEAFNAYSQIAVANQDAMNVMGDYVFRTMDVPYADEIAERWKRKIPPEIKGEGPGPEVIALRAELENVKGLLTDFATRLAEKDTELKGVRADKTVDAYNAETKRVVDVAKLTGGAEALLPVIVQAVQQALTQEWPPQSHEPEASDVDSGMPGGDDLPPLSDLPWDQRAQVDRVLSDGKVS